MNKTVARTGVIAAAAVLGCLVGFVILRQSRTEEPGPASTGIATLRQTQEAAKATEQLPSHRLSKHKTTPALREVSSWETNSPARQPAQRPMQSAAANPTAATGAVALQGQPGVAQDAMNRLLQIDPSKPLTREQAFEVNQMLDQLIGQGAAAVPAIQAYLARNEDLSFDGIAGGELVNFGSLRIGLIDALQRIGGQDAINASVQMLQGTADPLEIALLSRSLEQNAPAQYRQQELAAALEALKMAMAGTWRGDVSPVFETLQALGDPSVVPLLEQAVKQWNYYAAIALAGLPDGAGIPSLIKLSHDPSVASLGTGDFALRPLAQVAVQYPDAGRAIVDAARSNLISDSAWPTVIASLGCTYIQYGNQIFGSTAPPINCNAEASQRISLIDQLMSVTTNPTARQSLQAARTALAARLAG
jgi:hypothetical protein